MKAVSQRLRYQRPYHQDACPHPAAYLGLPLPATTVVCKKHMFSTHNYIILLKKLGSSTAQFYQKQVHMTNKSTCSKPKCLKGVSHMTISQVPCSKWEKWSYIYIPLKSSLWEVHGPMQNQPHLLERYWPQKRRRRKKNKQHSST